ncbi:MAG TPA: M1 family metallopeptidase [bacterium]|nr:M1 family metallopeptidase [bacterium]HQJ63053.1 M1 family metallopeptidase [bacterium]
MNRRFVALTALVCVLLLVAFSRAGMAQEVDTLRLGRMVVPLKQEIHFILDPAKESYQGIVDISLAVHEQTHYFRLHARELKISKLVLQSANRKIPVRWSTMDLLRISTGNPLLPGNCTLHIEFSGRMGSLGTGIFKSIEKGDTYLATQFEPVYARTAFPCWDEPGFKCPFRLTLTIPADLAAFSNTQIEKSNSTGKEQTLVFRETPPLPVYLVAFAVGPFDTIPLSGMSVPGSVVVPRGQGQLAAEAVQIIPLIFNELERRFGPYPFSKLDLVAVPGFMMAMENAGLITFYPPVLLMDPKVCTVEQKLGNWITIAHEIAHMWFGDLVTMAWWDDTWLNEGFATWIGLDVANTLFPQYNPFSWQIGSAQRAMSTDALPSASAVQRTIGADDDPWQAFDELSYQKAGAVLDMVSAWIGAEDFRGGILDFLGKNKWRAAAAGDLWSSLSAAASEPLDSVVASCIEQPGVPLIEVQIIPGPRLQLVQSRFMNSGFRAPSQRWKIPVVFKYTDGVKT